MEHCHYLYFVISGEDSLSTLPPQEQCHCLHCTTTGLMSSGLSVSFSTQYHSHWPADSLSIYQYSSNRDILVTYLDLSVICLIFYVNYIKLSVNDHDMFVTDLTCQCGLPWPCCGLPWPVCDYLDLIVTYIDMTVILWPVCDYLDTPVTFIDLHMTYLDCLWPYIWPTITNLWQTLTFCDLSLLIIHHCWLSLTPGHLWCDIIRLWDVTFACDLCWPITNIPWPVFHKFW